MTLRVHQTRSRANPGGMRQDIGDCLDGPQVGQGRRREESLAVGLRDLDNDFHQLLGVRVRKRAQQGCVHNRKERAGRPNPNSKRDHRYRCRTALAPELPNTVLGVLSESAHGRLLSTRG